MVFLRGPLVQLLLPIVVKATARGIDPNDMERLAKYPVGIRDLGFGGLWLSVLALGFKF